MNLIVHEELDKVQRIEEVLSYVNSRDKSQATFQNPETFLTKVVL